MTTPKTYRDHVKAITALGLPLVGSHLAQMAISVTDTVMLGWYSVEALAAVTLAGSYFFILFILGSGFALAVMPMVASFVAEGDETNIRRSTRMALWLSVGFGVLVMPLLIFSKPILLLLGQEPEVAQNAHDYLTIAGWGILPALLVMVLKSYLAALERAQVMLWVTIAAACTNALGNYALIFGNWGAPEMGLVGAAIASLATQTVSALGLLLYIVIVVPQHQLFVRLWRPDWQMLGRVFWLGLPIGLTTVAEVGLFTASTVMTGWLGTVPLAAHGIALQLSAMTFMVHLGLSNVATIRAGNAYGRRDLDHLRAGAAMVTLMSFIFACLTIIAFVGVPRPLLSLFIDSTEPARDQIMVIGTALLIMAALFQFVDGAQAIALGLLRGIMDTKIPMIIAVVSYWVIGISGAYVLGFVLDYKAPGIWGGLVLGLGSAGVMLNLRFWLSASKQIAGGKEAS